MTGYDLKKRILKLWPAVVLLIYVGINLFLLSRHESWRDEAQAWQIARLTGWSELFEQLKYEGHPVLWYLVLRLFAGMGLPFSYIGVISLGLMTAAALLLLTRAPFALPVKLLIVFSPFYVYYYPVVSRSYSLVPVILALLAWIYPERKSRPVLYGGLIALLTQTHIYMVAMSFMLSAVWLGETLMDLVHSRKGRGSKEISSVRRNLAGLCISLASALFLVWELTGSTELNASIDISPASTLSSNLHRLSVAAQWSVDYALGIGIGDTAWEYAKLLLIVCAVVLILFSWKEGVIFTLAAALQVVMFTFVYLPSEQKAMLVVHELIFMGWTALEKWRREVPDGSKMIPAGMRKHPLKMIRTAMIRLLKPAAQLGLAALAVTAVFGHFSSIRQDVEQPYSASRDTAAYIEENIPEDAVLVAAGYYTAYPIAAYLSDREIYYPPLDEMITFSVWNGEMDTYISADEMLALIRDRYPDCTEFYLISCGSDNVSGVTEIEGIELLFMEDAMISEESASVYLVKL